MNHIIRKVMPIQVLPLQVVKQIAAGEIVERPASVVKELIENSIDAGATRIDIDIEHGGLKLIRVRDNGCGIKKNELTLALARFATSKIASLEDLESILSFGFRGEALSSISSVSRLRLTSRTFDQEVGWQIYVEGSDTDIMIKPLSHPVGTTLEVLDLFYNTPARRRFMRTEKTEFRYIEEVIRCIALSHFTISISLRHNVKMIRNYCAVLNEKKKEDRILSIFGASFLEKAISIECQHSDLSLYGWIAYLNLCTPSLSDIQYFYVNERMIYNRVVRHAIRKAYSDKFGENRKPFFILYLKIDPHQVDINMHPTKREVRFYQSRIVYDFIYYSILSMLKKKVKSITYLDKRPEMNKIQKDSDSSRFNQVTKPIDTNNSASIHSFNSKYLNNEQIFQNKEDNLDKDMLRKPEISYKSLDIMFDSNKLQKNRQSFGKILTILFQNTALLKHDNDLALLALPIAEQYLKKLQLTSKYQIYAHPLLIPYRTEVTYSEVELIQRYQKLLAKIGIQITLNFQYVTLRAVPEVLLCHQYQDKLQKFIPELIDHLSQQTTLNTNDIDIVQWIVNYLVSKNTCWNIEQAISTITELEILYPQLVENPPGELLQLINLQSAMSALNNE